MSVFGSRYRESPLQSSGAYSMNSAGDKRQGRGYRHGPTATELAVFSRGKGLRLCGLPASHLQNDNSDSAYGPEGLMRKK